MKNHYVLFAVTLILLSCDSHKNSKLQVNDFRHAMSPQHIAIDFEDCRVYTISIGDTVYMNLETWSLVDSAAQGGIIYHNPVNLKSYQSQLKKQELDSMYYWVKMLIINPVNPKNFCTDYVGNVRFK